MTVGPTVKIEHVQSRWPLVQRSKSFLHTLIVGPAGWCDRLDQRLQCLDRLLIVGWMVGPTVGPTIIVFRRPLNSSLFACSITWLLDAFARAATYRFENVRESRALREGARLTRVPSDCQLNGNRAFKRPKRLQLNCIVTPVIGEVRSTWIRFEIESDSTKARRSKERQLREEQQIRRGDVNVAERRIITWISWTQTVIACWLIITMRGIFVQSSERYSFKTLKVYFVTNERIVDRFWTVRNCQTIKSREG